MKYSFNKKTWVSNRANSHKQIILIGWNKRWMLRGLSNMRNGKSPVSMSESVSQSVMMINARDANASKNLSFAQLYAV